MSALEVRKLKAGGRLCEHCLHDPGPSRSARFQLFVLGRPVERVCGLCAGLWRDTFERRGLGS